MYVHIPARQPSQSGCAWAATDAKQLNIDVLLKMLLYKFVAQVSAAGLACSCVASTSEAVQTCRAPCHKQWKSSLLCFCTIAGPAPCFCLAYSKPMQHTYMYSSVPFASSTSECLAAFCTFAQDLHRAGVEYAHAVFIVAPKHAEEPVLADRHAVMMVLALGQYLQVCAGSSQWPVV
jgi:hypothetical protein